MDPNFWKEYVSKLDNIELELPSLTSSAPVLHSILLGISELDEILPTDPAAAPVSVFSSNEANSTE